MATVYLCAGMPKTGTTALQLFLELNQELLQSKGYYYPTNEEFHINYPDTSPTGNGHFLTFRKQPKNSSKLATLQAKARKKGFDVVAKLAKEHSDIILSDERIWHQLLKKDHEAYFKQMIADFAEIGCEVRIIVYLRRQDDFILSLWNQRVKLRRFPYTFDEYITEHTDDFLTDYYQGLGWLSDYFGRENLIVRIYERGHFRGKNGTIFSDFLEIFGIEDVESFSTDIPRSNPSLNGNYVELRRLINSIPEYAASNDFIRKSVNSACQLSNDYFPQDQAAINMFTPQSRREFLGRYEESNRKVAEEYLHREDGVLFYEPIKDEPTWELNNNTLTRDFLFVTVKALCEQQKQLSKQAKEINELKKAVANLQKQESKTDSKKSSFWNKLKS